MKKILFFTFLFFNAGQFLYAQVPVLQAENCFGGTNVDHGFSVQQTGDGGYIFAGGTSSNDGNVHGNHGDDDFWVVKLNKEGKIQWQKALGGFGDDVAFSIQQTMDGGFAVAGESNSVNGNVTGNHGNLDFWVVRLDSSGGLVWQKSFGGSNSDFATSIKQTKDGGFIIAGGSLSNDGDVTNHHGNTSTADYFIVKTDADGNKQWAKCYGGSNGDIAQSIYQTKDGGYIIAGNSTSNDGDVTGVHDFVYGDSWIVKTDPQGNIQWQKAYGGSDYEQANSIVQTTDGGYIAAGWSRSNNGDVSGNHGDYDFWITKLGTTGSLQWQKSYGGSNGDLAYSIEQTKDNGYIVAGGTSSNNTGDVTGFHGKEDFWIVKLNNSGSLLWQKSLGGTEYEEARSIDETKDGGFIAAGWSGWDNSNNGDVTGNHSNNYDVWLAKLSASGLVAAQSNNSVSLPVNPAITTDFSISPNPATTFIQVDIQSVNPQVLLTIINTAGTVVMQKNLLIQKGGYHQQLNIASLTAGVYYIRISSGNLNVTKQFIKGS